MKRMSIKTGLVRQLLGERLSAELKTLAGALPGPVYLTGGTVRDLLLEREPVDIDLTVPTAARKWAGALSRALRGTYVPLGRDEDAARVVWQGPDVDFSAFRLGAETIDQELTMRDITVNSMALCLDDVLETLPGPATLTVIDPVFGLADLQDRCIRMTGPASFRDDPLRLLRVYRFAATLGFEVVPDTAEQVRHQHQLIIHPAAERVRHELNLILATDRAPETFRQMAATGLLFEILPELRAGVGMEQPASHHLDVFEHLLAALAGMLEVQADPVVWFPSETDLMRDYLASAKNRLRLRWAALLHDLGKPATVTIDEDRGGRITFYNHDREGGRQAADIGRRLRWSSEDVRIVSELIVQHMRPFHLSNVQRKGELSLKACLRLIRDTGELLPGLFLLAMADALAGRGEARPEKMESELDALYARVQEVRRSHVEPVRRGAPLLTGKDLIEELGLPPGPVFREILDLVEEARLEKRVVDRAGALALARAYVKNDELLRTP